jgi:flagellar biosynthesis/type III secretory pathway protein FliH
LEVIAVFTQEERDRELYQLRKMAEMDKVAFPLAFRQEGIEEGRKEGREEGLQKGEVVGRIHLSQRLLKQAPTPREELLKLSLDELHRLAETLEQQLLSRTNGAP